MTNSRCDLAVLDEQLAANTARRSGGELGVTVSIGVGCVPDTGSGLPALIAGSGSR
jgi:hypothetical protein